MHKMTTITSLALTLMISACVQEQASLESREQEQVVLPAPTLTPQPPAEEVKKHKPMIAQRFNPAPPMLMEKSVSIGSGAVAQDAAIDQYAPTYSVNRDNFGQIDENPVHRVSEQPVSTFSIDVDTGSYAVVRSHLNQGQLPPTNAVRIEEMINYFDYAFNQPRTADLPFSISSEVGPSPWDAHTQLVQIGLQALTPEQQRKPANLVFLIDVSGSMNSPQKLPLLKNAFRLLVKQLDENDKITMVVYAGSSGVVLETTDGDQRGTILAALDKLSAGGSTHGSAGIQLAYQMAKQSFIEDGINRVILATDGDFNVGTVDHAALLDLVERQKKQGVALTTLGFGRGNYNDHLMEQLADHADGNYAYIDNLNEARKTLVEQVSATLQTVAKDVKIQIEWNPAEVAEYRLIGYQNRVLQREDFNNDKVDAGEIGAGHTVTALYEITLTDSARSRIDELRYQSGVPQTSTNTGELAWLKLRYKKPQEDRSQLIEQALHKRAIKSDLNAVSDNLRFAASVAAFGDLLRGGQNLQQFDYADVAKLASHARGQDKHGYRAEFISLVELAEALDSAG
ncbi:MAG: VWA domain-containing protein [Gammaproteobacteria bacterium]|nr:VWA domain-containing protein [Gammaproteobacteria bacterium]